ncbi:MAG: hypothetical protein GWN01_16245 [Nitrosopumilaceae archaeon]|nr:hypothetical protein [Nitrosopumilaceae archaeon]NIU02388.1 hypothetical protein [Nitrosopumilaceae archaeon]NIU88845.1 hypothetical protein [Nitrosopumilaceae archaeon]NIV66969.1 hypothetical protein [Nitrosopumilaceae archaeon]NIX62989.1 hypothetical protein [Nitrosopumilaceae archaeon]
MIEATIRIDAKTKAKLSEFLSRNSTWDSVVKDLINHAEKCGNFMRWAS